MSYTVFALKWRPRDFDEVVGQPKVVTTLKSAIQKSRLANAYLFSGPRGVGKTSTARILAKALNCKNGPTPKPCNQCPACLDIAAGRSLDVLEIDGASNRGIDEIRALRENVKFSPAQSKFKVYIIDEVHQITQEGFNALLKTLEEPPEYVKFVFATTHPHKVPPTILSRCQHLDFRRISVLEMLGQLEKIVAQEKITIGKDVLLAVARSSDGSLRDAESMLDQLVSFAKGDISLNDVIAMLGLVEQETLFTLTAHIIQKDARAAVTLFNQIVDEGKDPGILLTHLIEHFRNLMIAKVTDGDQHLIDLPQEVCARLLEQAQAFSLQEVFSAFTILVNTQEMAKRLDSLRIPFEISLVRLAHDKNITVTRPAPAQAAQLPKEAPRAKTHPPETPPLEVPQQNKTAEQEEGNTVSAVLLETVKKIWQDVISNLSPVKMSVATYLSEGEPADIKGDVLTIAFPKNYSLHKEALEKKENKLLVEKHISQLCNAPLRVNLILSKQERHKEDIRNDSTVKSVLDIFNGRVVKEQ
ncbi:MAG: DNA polymerase III subunit gamma/tau [Candidatus Omnitrophica bacterium]|nr:DNA polymerase III subunit gamma/tau [Candidatus Omnitrophota bacterium]